MSLASSRTATSEVSNAPLSLETERRKSMRVVHQLEKDVTAFRERYLRKIKPDFPEDIGEFVQFVQDRNNAKRPPRTYQEFIVLLNKIRDAAEVVYKSEVDQLETAIITYDAFREAIQDFCGRLRKAVENHVGKYCHSFSAELGVYETPSVQFYENSIVRWRNQIKDAYGLLEDIMRNIKESTATFDLFLSNFPRVVHYMGLSLEVFPRIFDAIKDWVTSDEAYVKRVQDDMSELKREKMMLDCMTRRQRQAAVGIQSKVMRSQHHSKKLKEKLIRVRDDRRQCRKKEMALLETTTKVAAELSKKRENLEKVLKCLCDDDCPSSEKAKLLETSSQMNTEVKKLEKKMNGLKSELRQIKVERIAAQKEFHRMQNLCERNTKIEEDIQENAMDATQDVRDLEEERRVLGVKIMALARIRAIKLDPRTVKVIYSEGYTPGRKFDVPPELEEACRVAASEVGKDWPSLPISPRREGAHRLSSTSLESIDSTLSYASFASHISHHSVPGGGNRSHRGMDKWKKVSQEASVNALGRLSRSLRDVEDAEKVEKKVITVN